MDRKEINFGGEKINKKDFYKSKNLFKIENIDINKILVSKKESYDTRKSSKKKIIWHKKPSKKESHDTKKLSKYFIGYYTITHKAPSKDWLC